MLYLADPGRQQYAGMHVAEHWKWRGGALGGSGGLMVKFITTCPGS